MSELNVKSVLQTANSQLLLRHVLQELHSQEHLPLDQLIHIYQDIQGDINIPLGIFVGKRNPAEALCLFLKENKNLSYPKIAEILNRDPRSVWGTCQRAKKRNIASIQNNHKRYHSPARYIPANDTNKKSEMSAAQYKKNTIPSNVSEKYTIPIQIFHDRSKSLLEHIVFYLHQVHQLTNPQIAKLLHRSPNSIAVLYKRAREKKQL